MNKYLINQFRQFSFSGLVKCINRMDTVSFAEWWWWCLCCCRWGI